MLIHFIAEKIKYPKIFFSPSPDLQVESQLKLNLSLLQNNPLGISKKDQYKITAKIFGKAKSLQNKFEYSLRLDELKINDEKNLLILYFKRFSDQSLRYKTDEAFSEEERKAIFSLFQINTHNIFASDDNSLLQEKIQVTISKEGKLLDLKLPIRLKNALHAELKSNLSEQLLNHLIENCHKFPALLGKRPKKWTSKGYFLEELEFTHQELADGSFDSLATSLQPKELFLGKMFSLSQHQWKLKWNYDKLEKTIPFMEVNFQASFASKLLNKEERQDYRLHLEMKNSWKKPRFPVQEMKIL